MKIPGKLTDSTTGTAGETCDDSTSSVKDDMASIIAKVNAMVDAFTALEKRIASLEEAL